MYHYEYKTLHDLATLADRYGISLSEAALRHEMETAETDEKTVRATMAERLAVFHESIQFGLKNSEKSVSGLVGGDAAKLSDKGPLLLGSLAHKAATYAIAVNEANAKMFKIVACPTAGSCGILPAAVLAAAEVLGKCDADCIGPLYTAAAVVTELAGGTNDEVLQAFALAMKNILGLACDPVAGLVEVPCVKRNGIFSVIAITAAEMALAGVKSVIPPDEVIEALDEIGRIMPVSLKETAEGGLAKTKTGMEITRRLAAEAH